jgi:hypothetical protein
MNRKKMVGATAFEPVGAGAAYSLPDPAVHDGEEAPAGRDGKRDHIARHRAGLLGPSIVCPPRCRHYSEGR